MSDKVITICGSSRFVGLMAVAAWVLERDEQAIVMSLHLLPGWYQSPDGTLPKDHLAEAEGVADAMDELHLRKIDLSDEIYVVNLSGYVGDSTRREIYHAYARGVRIRWFDRDEIPGEFAHLSRGNHEEADRRRLGAIMACRRPEPSAPEMRTYVKSRTEVDCKVNVQEQDDGKVRVSIETMDPGLQALMESAGWEREDTPVDDAKEPEAADV